MILKKHYKFIYTGAFILSLVFALLSLLFINNYIGYVGFAVNATAGYIHELHIEGPVGMHWWSGFKGIAVFSPSNTQPAWLYTTSAGEITRYDFFFSCHGKTGFDIYASTLNQSDLNLSAVVNGDPVAVDNWINISSSAVYSANSSFNTTMSINFGEKRVRYIGIDQG